MWDRFFTALKGAYSIIIDKHQRDALERAIEEKLINEQVLERAFHGPTIMLGLFQNLQNPLWKETKSTDFQEFLSAAPSALENFHDTLGKLSNENISKETPDATEEGLEAQIKNCLAQGKDIQELQIHAVLGMNEWKELAEKDPTSDAAIFSKMVTPPCFDAFYYRLKVESIIAPPFVTVKHEVGSPKVSQVALLNARVQVAHDHAASHDSSSEKITVEHEEFQASEGPDPPVVAQIDLLYEITQSQMVKYLTEDDIIMDISKYAPDAEDSPGKSSPGPSDKVKSERVTYTKLVVAVFEGWLRGGPEKELRWRLAMLREPFEFPYSPPTLSREDL